MALTWAFCGQVLWWKGEGVAERVEGGEVERVHMSEEACLLVNVKGR